MYPHVNFKIHTCHFVLISQSNFICIFHWWVLLLKSIQNKAAFLVATSFPTWHPSLKECCDCHLTVGCFSNFCLFQPIPEPKGGRLIQVEGYWISVGDKEPTIDEAYILTSSVKLNLRDIVRVVSAGCVDLVSCSGHWWHSSLTSLGFIALLLFIGYVNNCFLKSVPSLSSWPEALFLVIPFVEVIQMQLVLLFRILLVNTHSLFVKCPTYCCSQEVPESLELLSSVFSEELFCALRNIPLVVP